MPVNVKDFWDKLERKHLKIHGVYRTNEFNKLPEKPGLYSWHINSSALNFGSYFKAFKQKKVEINVKGNLTEKYEGEIKRAYYENDFDSPLIDHDLCEFASHVFCPPLYIGISVSLKTRINDHFAELVKIYNGKITLPTVTKIGQTDFDTIVESSHFAQRFGFTLFELKNIKLDDVFLKTIELDSTYSWADLQRVEKYLNRTFIPMYGRK